jgi:spermidine synthase
MTREFLEEVAAVTADGGVVAANTFAISDLYDHESVTYASVFEHFFNLRPPDSGNRVILARQGPLPSPDTLQERAERLDPWLDPYGVDLAPMVKHLATEPDWDTDARVLTDQYSPANLLLNR